MMRRTGWGTLLAIFALAGCGGGTAEWKEINSKEGRFTVRLPGSAKEEKLQQETTSVGPITLIVHVLESGKDTYRVEYTDLPPKTPFELDVFVKAIAARYDGKVTDQKEHEFAGHKGRAFEIEAQKPKGYVTGRVYVVKNRLYQLLAIGPNARASSAEVQKFFDSFKLIDPLLK